MDTGDVGRVLPARRVGGRAAIWNGDNIPVIAIEIPHPGATYFGADNYQAGLIGGKALGRWAKENWGGEVDQVLLLELPIAGPLPQLRVTGLLDALRKALPTISHSQVFHLDGKGDFDQILDVARRFLRRSRLKADPSSAL